MDADLTEKMMAALHESQGDVTAVARVVIEACVNRIGAHRAEMQLLERESRGWDQFKYDYYLARRHEAEYLIAVIRALAGEAGK